MIPGILVGGFLVLLGIQRISMAPSAGGVAAGILMVLAGLIIAQPTRVTIEELMGQQMSKNEKIAVAMTCFAIATVLNLMFP